MIVTDNKVDAVEAALEKALEEGSPVEFGFSESDTDAQKGAFAIEANAQGDEHGAIQQLAVVPDLFIAGVQDQVGKAPRDGSRQFWSSASGVGRTD